MKFICGSCSNLAAERAVVFKGTNRKVARSRKTAIQKETKKRLASASRRAMLLFELGFAIVSDAPA